MTLRRILSIFAFFALITGATAQDVHYTLHNMSPLTLNPANQGAFSGSIRVSGILRAQWYGVAGPKTPGLGIDAPIVRGLRKQDWIGVGFNMVFDRSGSSSLGNIARTTTGFGASYHFAFDKKQTTVLTLGAQYGGTKISYIAPTDPLDQERIFSTDLGGGGSNQGEMIGASGSSSGDPDENPNDNYTDINAGLMLRTLLDEKDNNTLEVGVAMMRITNDDFRAFTSRDTSGTTVGEMLGSNSQESREAKRTLHAHATLDYKLTDKIRLMPTLFYQNSANNSSLSIQAWAGYSLKNEMLFKFGLGYRTGDAAKILVGLQKDRLQVAASYDVAISQSQLAGFQSGTPNSFELAANYIFNIYKKPVVNPELLCPKI